MHKLLLTLGSISGLLTVAIGAFGAHALKNTLQETGHTANFETGVKYQMFHTVAIFIVALLSPKVPASAGYFFGAGILLFSGSLYILSITGVTKWGMVTPIGGVAFMIGWGIMLYYFLKL